MDDYNKSRASTMTERELGRNLLALVHILGGKAVHFRPGRTERGWRTAVEGDGEGYPDWTIFLPSQHRSIFVELKREDGDLTIAQLEYRQVIKDSGGEYYYWRPSDWLSGEIEKVLRGGVNEKTNPLPPVPGMWLGN